MDLVLLALVIYFSASCGLCAVGTWMVAELGG